MFDDIIDEELGASRRKKRKAKRKVRRAKKVKRRVIRRASPRRKRVLKKVGKAFGGIVTGGASLAVKKGRPKKRIVRKRRIVRKSVARPVPKKRSNVIRRKVASRVRPGLATIVTGKSTLTLPTTVTLKTAPKRRAAKRRVMRKRIVKGRVLKPGSATFARKTLRPASVRKTRKVFQAPKFTVQRKAEVMSKLADRLAKASLRKAQTQATTPTDGYRVKILKRLREIGVKLPSKHKTRMKMNRKIILICKPMLKGLRRRRAVRG